MGSKNDRELRGCQEAMDLETAAYEANQVLPADERLGLTSPIRRAEVSIPASIAMGEGQGADKRFVDFLRVAHGSVWELETRIMIAARLGYVRAAVADGHLPAAAEVGKIIMGLIRCLS